MAEQALHRLPCQRVRRDVDRITGEVIEAITSAQAPPNARFHHRVDTWREGVEAVVEVSLPRYATGHNTDAVSVEHASELIEQIHADTLPDLPWLAAAEELEVMRLDLVRDFTNVVQPAPHLRGLLDVPAVRAQSSCHTAPGSASLQSLYRQTERWRAKLYLREESPSVRRHLRSVSDDAWGEVQDQNRGRLRYELQLRSTSLRANQIRTVRDLDQERAATIARRYFVDRCRFHVPVGDSLGKMRMAISQLETDGREREVRSVSGQLVLDAASAPLLGRSRTALAHRKTALDLGLTHADVFTTDGRSGRRYLDFDSGRLVGAIDAFDAVS